MSGIDITQILQHAVALHQSGKLPEALELYEQVLASHPDHADALHLSGMVAFQMGDTAQAVERLNAALALAPDNAAVHNNLGTVLKASGELEAAAEAYGNAVALQPDYVMGHYNLATALKSLGRMDEAEAAFRKALELKPDFAEALNNLGLVLGESGRTDEAVAAHRRAIKAKPDHAEAYVNLGAVLQAAGAPGEAVEAFRQAIAIRPDFAEAHYNLAFVLQTLRKREEAEEVLHRAIELNPDLAEVHNTLGALLLVQGRLSEAEPEIRRALELEPDNADVLSNLGDVLLALGEGDEAEATLRRALEIAPDQVQAWLQLARLKTFRKGDGDIAAMEKLRDDPAGNGSKDVYLNYALGKAYEDVGEDDKAFSCFDTGARLKRATLDYDIAKEEVMVGRIIETFDTDLFARNAGNGCPSDQPIFVLGMMRSGTSLVEQILASHSQVFGADERPELQQLARHLAQRPDAGGDFPRAVAELGGEDLLSLGEGYVARIGALAPEARHITDKMPANFLYIGLIHLILPNARIIHCLRDPVDTCFGCYKVLFGGDQDFTYDLAELGRYYRLYERLMDHWRDVLPGRIYDLTYEDLVADQEGETRRLLEFCGLSFEAACMAFHETARPVHTASAAQVRRPIFTASVGRAKRYEKHLQPLLDALGKDRRPGGP